jgi:methylmalonyl-CoA mutase C-terminal domain/subunit
MEVIYTGLHQSAEQIVEAALQEDVDVVALSILSGAHMTLFPEVLRLMRERGIGDKLLTGGGIIPTEDMETLAGMGVGRLYGPGASTQDIAAYIRDWFVARHGAGALAPLPPPPPRPAVPPRVTAREVAHHRAVPASPAARAAAKPRGSARPSPAKRAARGRSKPAREPARPQPKPRRAAARAGATPRKGGSARKTAARSRGR